MNKPNWEIQDKKVIVSKIELPGILDLYRFEARGNKFRGTHWMVAVNKKTGKVLTEPGTRKHMQFSDTDEAIGEISKWIAKKMLTV